MNSDERTSKLYVKANAKGWDHPDDTMISDAIFDAEQDVEQDILGALKEAGFHDAVKYLNDRQTYLNLARQEDQFYASLDQDGRVD